MEQVIKPTPNSRHLNKMSLEGHPIQGMSPHLICPYIREGVDRGTQFSWISCLLVQDSQGQLCRLPQDVVWLNIASKDVSRNNNGEMEKELLSMSVMSD